MIYVTGDTHGCRQIGYHSVDGFMHRLSTESFPEGKEMTKEDFVVILGDFGGVWGTDRHACTEPAQEKYALDWLEKKNFTTLFVPGNHENYDRLTGCEDEELLESWLYAEMPDQEKDRLRRGYPRKAWHGGFVRELRPSVLMLESGYIFELCGKSCFAFGGARSHDIQDGILNPCDYADEKEFKNDYTKRKDGMIRVYGVSWWKQEMPGGMARQMGLDNIEHWLDEHREIDFAFTHDAPATDKIFLGYDSTDELNDYFQRIADSYPVGSWFFGHLHDNRKTGRNHFLLYEQIIRIV